MAITTTTYGAVYEQTAGAAGGLESVFNHGNTEAAKNFFARQGKFPQEYWTVFQENLTKYGGKRAADTEFPNG
jgi:hypothetical protein